MSSYILTNGVTDHLDLAEFRNKCRPWTLLLPTDTHRPLERSALNVLCCHCEAWVQFTPSCRELTIHCRPLSMSATSTQLPFPHGIIGCVPAKHTKAQDRSTLSRAQPPSPDDLGAPYLPQAISVVS